MTKSHLILFSVLLILTSCNITQLSSEGLSTSTSTSSSTKAVSESSLVSLVASGAYKYDGGLNPNNLATKAGVAIDANSTNGNLVLLLKAAFGDSIPSLTGQRKYGGVYTNPEETNITTAKVKEAFDWLCSYGLWDESPFVESAAIDDDFITKILHRFYSYYGTEETDDYYAYQNHDFLYEAKDESDITSSSEYYQSLLLDSNATEKNMMEYVKELADDSSSSSSSFYQRALSFYEGALDYSFIDEEGIKEEIESIKSISNTAKWLAIASSGLKNYGSSSIAFFTTPNTTILEDGTSINQYTLIPGRLFDYLSPEINETSLKTMASDMYQDLGLSSEEIENHSSAFVSFSKKQWTAYRSTDIAKYQNTFSLLYDSATKSDPITSFGLSFDLAGAFINAGFSYDDISKFATIDLAAYLSLAKAVTEATPAELCSTALYNFAYDNSDLKKYHQGTKPDFELVRTMINNRLSSDYASSSLYTQSYNTIKTMFTGIESVFSDRLTNSSWLSDDGKKKAQEKLDAIQTNFLGKSDDGTVFDYSSLAAPLGKTISKTIGGAKRNLVNYFLSRVSTGIDNDEKSLIASGPFFGNAFYYPSYNRISLNLGALFYVGSDLSKVSQEELYARIGFVLGHEITHGFDSQGVYYDKNGNHSTTSIIPEADQSKFDELALKLEGLYKDQEIVPGLSQDAHLTITEDLADTGGFVFSENAGKAITAFDFKSFYSYLAKSFGFKASRSSLESTFIQDPHSSGRIRLDPLLSNSPTFQEIYDLNPRDGMYLASSSQVVIW